MHMNLRRRREANSKKYYTFGNFYFSLCTYGAAAVRKYSSYPLRSMSSLSSMWYTFLYIFLCICVNVIWKMDVYPVCVCLQANAFNGAATRSNAKKDSKYTYIAMCANGR